MIACNGCGVSPLGYIIAIICWVAVIFIVERLLFGQDGFGQAVRNVFKGFNKW